MGNYKIVGEWHDLETERWGIIFIAQEIVRVGNLTLHRQCQRLRLYRW